VDLITRDRVIGWAFNPDHPNTPIMLEIMEREKLLLQITADEAREDLAEAGFGNGNYGFSARLPSDFSSDRVAHIHVRRADDKKPVKFEKPTKVGLLASPTAMRASTHPAIDLLSSPTSDMFHLEMTTRCDLRCVYCAVSQEWYHGVDMDIGDFDSLVQQLKDRRVKMIAVSGHGETTMIPDWHQKINLLADAGLRVRITTNFARVLRQEELEAMAHMSEIMVSIDTHRPELQRKIRRHVNIGNILINMTRVAASAAKLELPKPNFTWNCVVTDQVALDLVDYIHFGLSCGVRHFTLSNLTKYDDIKNATNVRHVTTLPVEDLRRFLELIKEVRAITSSAGAKLSIYSGLLDTVQDELTRREVA
jgi:MoaA/NifB/PqqE/SkfB family radical SAM enzyme